jgi:hypothetical protein
VDIGHRPNHLNSMSLFLILIYLLDYVFLQKVSILLKKIGPTHWHHISLEQNVIFKGKIQLTPLKFDHFFNLTFNV